MQPFLADDRNGISLGDSIVAGHDAAERLEQFLATGPAEKMSACSKTLAEDSRCLRGEAGSLGNPHAGSARYESLKTL